MPEVLATESFISDSSEMCVARSAYQDLLLEGFEGGLELAVAPEKRGLQAESASGQGGIDAYEVFSGQLQTRVGHMAIVLAPEDVWIYCPEGPVDHINPQSLISEPQEDWMEFRRLVGQWKTQRGVLSSVTQSALCPAYQSIIAMGRRAVPLILRQMKSEGSDPDQWFWALQVITGEQPVEDEDRGNYRKMAHAWLDWGQREEYDW